jgi:hypothetical protein
MLCCLSLLIISSESIFFSGKWAVATRSEKYTSTSNNLAGPTWQCRSTDQSWYSTNITANILFSDQHLASYVVLSPPRIFSSSISCFSLRSLPFAYPRAMASSSGSVPALGACIFPNFCNYNLPFLPNLTFGLVIPPPFASQKLCRCWSLPLQTIQRPSEMPPYLR